MQTLVLAKNWKNKLKGDRVIVENNTAHYLIENKIGYIARNEEVKDLVKDRMVRKPQAKIKKVKTKKWI